MLEKYDDVIKVEELCEILNIGKNTAYRILQNDLIPNCRIGRKYIIPKCGVTDYLRNIKRENKI